MHQHSDSKSILCAVQIYCNIQYFGQVADCQAESTKSTFGGASDEAPSEAHLR